MVVKVSNNYRTAASGLNRKISYSSLLEASEFVTPKAKFLAWSIFLIFFIENGTLGLLPKSFYFIYRNMRISDFLIYALTFYSLFNVREYIELYTSKSLVIIKLLLLLLLGQFIVSVILYEQNIIEYFFRLKGVWFSFLVFPFLLLIKRNGLKYLAKIILPFAVVSNILYIMSAVTGVAFMPDIGIDKQDLPGGLKVYRVFGGTFFGEFFFLYFVYQWITDKIRLWQLPLIILFVTPHILAFGRAAWLFMSFVILAIFIWNIYKTKQIKVIIRQISAFAILLSALVYFFINYVPESEYLTDALEARVTQGQQDLKYKTGTYGTRLQNIDALISLWYNTNVLFGIGMHPLWVIKAQTEEENIYAWGFSDVRWAAILAAYGLTGFIIAIIFQLYYGFLFLKILKKSPLKSVYTFFILLAFCTFFFDTFINYSYKLFSLTLWGLSQTTALFIAVTVYKYHYPEK